MIIINIIEYMYIRNKKENNCLYSLKYYMFMDFILLLKKLV